MVDKVAVAAEIDAKIDAEIESDDDESETGNNYSIQLGFAEKECCNNLFLERNWQNWDGGRIGGLPVWLDYSAIPTTEELECPDCKDPMLFLLEIYSPFDNNATAFHRAIYVFCCRKPACVKSNRGFKCLRTQLPKVNSLYPADPSQISSAESEFVPLDSLRPHLCALCGCRAKSACSRCRTVRYCGKAHQKQHWKSHKTHCSENNNTVITSEQQFSSPVVLDASQQKALFPVYEIVIEPESAHFTYSHAQKSALAYDFSQNTQTILDQVPENCNVWDDAVTHGGEDEESDRKITQQDYNKALSEQKYDPVYINFLTSISSCSQQVLRYNADSLHRSNPAHTITQQDVTLEMQERGRLYVSRQMQREVKKVPPCPHCGSARVLEFQIMPQILHYLGVDKNTQVNIRDAPETEITGEDGQEKAKRVGSIENRFHDDLDWGTVDIYTCVASCGGSIATDAAVDSSLADSSLKPYSRYITEHIELQEIPDLMSTTPALK